MPITPLDCSLVGQQQPAQICAANRARSFYRSSQAKIITAITGLNPIYTQRLERTGLVVGGTGPAGEVRMVEIPSHPFFIATLFLPQTRSTQTRLTR